MRIDHLSEAELSQLIEAGFAGVPLHRHFGLQLTCLSPVTVEMPLTDESRGFVGGVHGGALASLIDVATNCAAALSDQFDLTTTQLATLDLHVRYLRQPSSGPVVARSALIHEGRRILQVDTAVTEPSGSTIATASAFVSVSA